MYDKKKEREEKEYPIKLYYITKMTEASKKIVFRVNKELQQMIKEMLDKYYYVYPNISQLMRCAIIGLVSDMRKSEETAYENRRIE